MKEIKWEQLQSKQLIAKHNYRIHYLCDYQGQKKELQEYPGEEQVNLNLRAYYFELQKVHQLLKSYPNQYIENFIAFYFDLDNHFFTLKSYVDGVTLYILLTENKVYGWSLEQKLKLCYQLSLGISYLHQHDFIHRNLTTANVELDVDNQLLPKIRDIGLFGLLDALDSKEKTQKKRDELYWKAPEFEVINYTVGSVQGDIYSLGVLMYEILSGKALDPKDNKLNEYKKWHPTMHLLPKVIRDLILACINQKPELRPSCTDIIAIIQPFVGGEYLDSIDFDITLDQVDLSILNNEQGEEETEQQILKEVEVCYQLALSYLKVDNYIKAANLFDVPAWNHHADAQYHLGKLYLFGLGREKNCRTAMIWLEKAANQRHLEAEFLLAQIEYFKLNKDTKSKISQVVHKYQRLSKKNHLDSLLHLAYFNEFGIGVDLNYTNAIEYYTAYLNAFDVLKGTKENNKTIENNTSNNQNIPMVLYRLAMLYEDGLGIEKSIPYAIKLYLIGIEYQHAHCAYRLGQLYASGLKIRRDLTKAHAYLKLAKRGMHPKAIYELGKMNLKGIGMQSDYQKALENFRLAAQFKVARAYHSIAYMYDLGNGVEKNFGLAYKWYLKGAEAGDRLSQNNLARYYQLGIGTMKDMGKAIYWYQLSAKQGVGQAMVNLGKCYESGQGVEKDCAKAYEYYKLAAEQNDLHGLFKLGACYEAGVGINKDLNLCLKYYKRAGDKGFLKAKQRFELIYNLVKN
ncbi:HCP-like protein [Neoconidiobolus thromboides FSU 785]|nr:HCP-like protein [Neoconidiobolus thromboides FSU 785]